MLALARACVWWHPLPHMHIDVVARRHSLSHPPSDTSVRALSIYLLFLRWGSPGQQAHAGRLAPRSTIVGRIRLCGPPVRTRRVSPLSDASIRSLVSSDTFFEHLSSLIIKPTHRMARLSFRRIHRHTRVSATSRAHKAEQTTTDNWPQSRENVNQFGSAQKLLEFLSV